jgi:mRNA-degrading endonuclease RelE of RelBE toxin-antitoxin system
VTYEVVFRDEARKAFLRLDKAIQKRVQRVIDRLAENPRPSRGTRAAAWRRAGAVAG